MPYKDPARNRQYQRARTARARAEFLDGKRCIDCGSTEHLELDHVDPASKESHKVWSWSPARRAAEIAKCVIRCRACHQARHAAERRRHGTVGRYRRGCRCEPCRAAKSVAQRKYRTSKKEPRMTVPPLTAVITTPDGGIESELVVVENDDPRVVLLILDDGVTLEFDRAELTAAISVPSAGLRAA